MAEGTSAPRSACCSVRAESSSSKARVPSNSSRRSTPESRSNIPSRSWSQRTTSSSSHPQAGVATGQRVWNRHPWGGRAGSGTVPSSGRIGISVSSDRSGLAARSASVYG